MTGRRRMGKGRPVKPMVRGMEKETGNWDWKESVLGSIP
jgi:hypothetical protein